MDEDKVIFAPTARRLSPVTTPTESSPVGIVRQEHIVNHASIDEPRGRMSPPQQAFPKRVMIPDHGVQRRKSSSTGASEDDHLSDQIALRIMLEARFQSEGDHHPQRECNRSFVDGRPMLRSFPTASISPEVLLEAVYRRRECDEDRLVARVAAAVVKPLENRLNMLEKSMSDVVLKLAVAQHQHQAPEAQQHSHLRSHKSQSNDRDLLKPADARPMMAGTQDTSAITSVLRPYLAAAAAEALSQIRQVQATETGVPPPFSNRHPSPSGHNWESQSHHGPAHHLGDARSRRPPSLGGALPMKKSGNRNLQGQTIEEVLAAAHFSNLVSGSQSQSSRQGHPHDHHHQPQKSNSPPATVLARGVGASGPLPSLHSNPSVKAGASSSPINRGPSPASWPKRKRDEHASREYPANNANESLTGGQSQGPPPSDWAEPRERKRRPQQCSICALPRFGTFGHTIEGWCPVHSQWGARSKCSICGEMRSKVPGHLPDGFCPTQKKWDLSIQRRHHAEATVSEQAPEDLARRPSA